MDLTFPVLHSFVHICFPLWCFLSPSCLSQAHIEQIEADAELESPHSSLDSAAVEHGTNVDFLRRIYEVQAFHTRSTELVPHSSA